MARSFCGTSLRSSCPSSVSRKSTGRHVRLVQAVGSVAEGSQGGGFSRGCGGGKSVSSLVAIAPDTTAQPWLAVGLSHAQGPEGKRTRHGISEMERQAIDVPIFLAASSASGAGYQVPVHGRAAMRFEKVRAQSGAAAECPAAHSATPFRSFHGRAIGTAASLVM